MHPWVGLSDEVRLGLLTGWIVPELVDEVLAACGRQGVKSRALTGPFMVYFVLTLAPRRPAPVEPTTARRLTGVWSRRGCSPGGTTRSSHSRHVASTSAATAAGSPARHDGK
ncbi:transposase domain-containing protein [Streptomyces sp. NBC_01477]|uniref:transposase domain-containing protein n=1 Tax=Streptomyces sp. NBC_01477 TaxID=2976015 RepID=UPI003FCC8806